MKISKYLLYTDKSGVDLHIAVVADLHSRPYSTVVQALKIIKPDIILLAGDILEIAAPYMRTRNKNGFEFLREALLIAPVYYTYGNHEIYYSHAKRNQSKAPDPKMFDEHLSIIRNLGVHIINDSFEQYTSVGEASNIFIGGVVCGYDKNPAINLDVPNMSVVNEFASLNGYKILLCHYPHYYDKYLKNTDIDLILSGHAHGGQWRIFGRAVYAPHQGFFPKYTSGLHDNKLLISRGVVNNLRFIPRLFNPCEVLDVRISSK